MPMSEFEAERQALIYEIEQLKKVQEEYNYLKGQCTFYWKQRFTALEAAIRELIEDAYTSWPYHIVPDDLEELLISLQPEEER